MRRLQCPRCAAVVLVEDGKAPACPSCRLQGGRQGNGPLVNGLISVAIVIMLAMVGLGALVGTGVVKVGPVELDRVQATAGGGSPAGAREVRGTSGDGDVAATSTGVDPEGNTTGAALGTGAAQAANGTPDTPEYAHAPTTYSPTTYTTAPKPADGYAAGSLARIVTARIDDTTAESLAGLSEGTPEEVLRAVADVRWEYTHEGDRLPVGAVSVGYMDATGTLRQRGMGDFTTRTHIAPGDVVSIGPADLLGDVTVFFQSSPLATRATVETAWLTGGDLPLPLAAGAGAEASWDVAAEVAFLTEVEGFDGTEGGNLTVDEASLTQSASYEGTYAVRGLPEGGGLLLDATAALDAGAEAHGSVRGSWIDHGQTTPFEASVDATFDATFTGVAQSRFSPTGALMASGAGGSAYIDGQYASSFTLGDQTETLSDDDMQHPLVDVSQPLVMEPFSAEAPDAAAIAFLRSLWGLDAAPGDRASLVVAMDGVELEAVLQVEAGGSRTVDGASVPVLRVTTTLELSGDALPQSAHQSIQATQWVHAQRYIPVFAQVTHTQTFTEQDLEDAFAQMGAPFEAPIDFTFTVVTSSTMELTELSGPLAVPAVMMLQGPGSGMFSTALAGAAAAVTAGL